MNIFNISRDLEDIFYQIEENGGEITPELEEQLAIKEEELHAKLDSYRRVHSKMLSDAKTCKEEETRIAKLRKTKEAQAERLKTTMLEAVQRFGATGKSGNKLVNLPDAKLYTKATVCTEIDNNRASVLMQIFLDIYRTAWEQDTLDAQYGKMTNNELLEKINAKYKENYDLIYSKVSLADTPEFMPFSFDDLVALRINFQFSYNLVELNGADKFSLLNAWFDNEESTSNFIESDVSKTVVKSMIKDGLNISVARIEEHDSLIIK